MTPVAGLIPYDVNVPLSSDGAAKNGISLYPKGKEIGFSPTGQWEFPVGAVLIKTFFSKRRREAIRIPPAAARNAVHGA